MLKSKLLVSDDDNLTELRPDSTLNLFLQYKKCVTLKNVIVKLLGHLVVFFYPLCYQNIMYVCVIYRLDTYLFEIIIIM